MSLDEGAAARTHWGHALVSAMLLLPVLLGGLFSLATFIASANDTPDAADYQRLSSFLDDNASLKDAVAVLPAWSLRVHQAAEGRATIVTGDALATRPQGRFNRVYVVREPGGEADFEEVVRAWGTPVKEVSLGHLDVFVFEHSERLVSDFRADIAQADVRVVGEEPVHCTVPVGKRGLDCAGRKEWQRVTREFNLVSENGDEMLWAHPPKPGHALVVSFDDVPSFERLVLRTALTRHASTRVKVPVLIEVFWGESLILRTEHGRGFGVRNHEVSLEDFAEGTLERGAKTLSFRVSSEAHGAAHFMFDAFTTEGPAPSKGTER